MLRILTQFIGLMGNLILPPAAHKFVIAGLATHRRLPVVPRSYFFRNRSSRTTSPPPLFSSRAGSACAAWAGAARAASVFSIAVGAGTGVGVLAAAPDS